MIQQFPAALPEANCRALVQLAEAWVAESMAETTSWRPATFLFDQHWAAEARGAVQGALRACIDSFGVQPAADTETLYVEAVALTALGEGDEIPLHADNCQLDEAGHWVPSEYRQRCLSAVLYLNQDFDGGEILFDRQALAIKPRTGLLVVFPSDHRFTHCVKAVSAGRRYALAMWFTAHRWYALMRQPIALRRPA